MSDEMARFADATKAFRFYVASGDRTYVSMLERLLKEADAPPPAREASDWSGAKDSRRNAYLRRAVAELGAAVRWIDAHDAWPLLNDVEAPAFVAWLDGAVGSLRAGQAIESGLRPEQRPKPKRTPIVDELREKEIRIFFERIRETLTVAAGWR